jgi:hypothetical protein
MVGSHVGGAPTKEEKVSERANHGTQREAMVDPMVDSMVTIITASGRLGREPSHTTFHDFKLYFPIHDRYVLVRQKILYTGPDKP